MTKGKLTDTFNKEAIKNMTFKEFDKSQKKACAFHKLGTEEAYFLLTGRKPEKEIKKEPEKEVKKPEKKVSKK